MGIRCVITVSHAFWIVVWMVSATTVRRQYVAGARSVKAETNAKTVSLRIKNKKKEENAEPKFVCIYDLNDLGEHLHFSHLAHYMIIMCSPFIET